VRITTTYTTNAKGEGRLVAKGEGKQRTTVYDHSASPARNHGLAAGELALVLVQGERARQVAANTAKRLRTENGKMVFTLGV